MICYAEIHVMSSVYGVSLERRMFDKILFEVDCNDMPR
jgi:hypothetical protein